MTFVLAGRSKEQAEKERQLLEEAAKEINASPETARAFLIKHGFITEDGKLGENYR